MTATSPKAFMLSATLHGTVLGLLLLFSYVVNLQSVEQPKVFELVAGEGDNYMAREAPALGTPDGVKVAIPKTPEPRPVPPEPATPEVAPQIPTPPKTEPAPTTDFKKKLTRDLIRADSKAKREIKKEKDAEAKKVAEDQKRLTKEEFDRANKAKSSTPPAKNAPTKVAKIDAEGIAKGVVGGSSANKVGGAGGKALKNDNIDDVLTAYYSLILQEVRKKFESPPGLGDTLKVTIELNSNADGSLTGARVLKSSGNSDFDRAVLDAIRRVRAPARPDKKSESIQFDFNAREKNEG